MQAVDQIRNPLVRGRIGVWRVYAPVRAGRESRGKKNNANRVELIAFKPNQIQYQWGAIAAECIGRGNRNYKVSALYIEYENVADPADPVTIPVFARDERVDYYQDLSFSASRDFLRVPLSFEPTIGIEQGFEDFFTAGTNGNKLTFFTQTQGTSGFHGKAFTNAANSKVFGVALVATPEFADPTKDLIFARSYFNLADQTVKEVSSQVGITWEISFE